MNTMIHRGYAARIDYSEDDGCFVGHIAGINDIVGFHGESVAELRAGFEEAVDDYLQTCKKLDRSPQTPHFGDLMAGVSPQKHAATGIAAEDNGKSVSQWVTDRLADAEIPMPGLLGDPQ